MRTLVLNKAWVPIAHISWKRAFSLICKGSAEPLKFYEEIVRSPNDFHFIPAVIQLSEYDKIPRTKVSYSKRNVFIRDRFSCQYCNKRLTMASATIDHVVPRSHGGKTTFENTVASCFSCNNRKGNKDLKHTKLRLMRKPKRPEKQTYVIKVGKTISKEWADYLPRGILEHVQIAG